MRRILIVLAILALAGGGWWAWNNGDSMKDTLGQYVGNGELLTFKARYTADQLMEKHRKELLPDAQHTYREATLKYYPYLLIETKYANPDKKTREGTLLWSLVDGEIVLDTDSWETTRGFEDAIAANANSNDFKIMYALARHDGTMTRDQLQQELHLDPEILSPWISSIRQKKLIVQSGDLLQLHLEEPNILINPQTKVRESLVSKPYSYAQCASKKYSRSQIEKTAQAAFGTAFTIRNITEAYLPVHCLEVSNPDGSVLTSYWNALTDQRMD